MGRKKKVEVTQVELSNDQSDTARDPLLEAKPKDAPEAGHADRKHALLAPSSAKRWMACPGSVALSLKCPKPEDSAYAAEGTHAHEVSEKILSAWLLDDMDVLPAIEKYKHLFLNAEMEDCVVSYILTIGRLISGKKLDRIAIEKRFILDAELGIFGTADVAFKYKKAGKLTKDKTIVITVTGHGLKDIPYALEAAKKPVIVPVNAKIAAKALGLA